MRMHLRGFTLLETLLVISLLIVMMLALTFLYSKFTRFYVFQNASALNASTTGKAISDIDSVVISAIQVLSSHTFSTGSYSSNATTLVTQLPSIDSSGGVISGTFDYAVVYVSGGKAYRRIEAAGASDRRTETKLLAEGVQSLTFTYNSGDFTAVTRVETNLSTQVVLQTGPVSTTLRSEAYLRNK